MTAYYNEHDPFAAAWLRELIKAGQIAPGIVDKRSIEDVRPDELAEFSQCHFFAGIGGWSHALRLAGWPDARPVWTGSCPCQPFSAAGKQAGVKDERHLWPEFFRLIRECRPDVLFGEQVAAAVRHDWLDLVSTDLEGEGYAVGSVVLGAHSVGAPHLRQRLWFVADRDSSRRGEGRPGEAGDGRGAPRVEFAGLCAVGELGNTDNAGPQGLRGNVEQHDKDGRKITQRHEWPAGFWDAADWLSCRDGKARPVEPGTFPLAHGVSARVGRLRGYGNAVVPQVAAEVIRAYMQSGRITMGVRMLHDMLADINAALEKGNGQH